MPKTSLHAFKAKDTRFVADWLKSKGLHKLFSAFEGIQEPFILSLACKECCLKPCLHTQLLATEKFPGGGGIWSPGMDLWWGIWTAFRPREGGIWTKIVQKYKCPGVARGGLLKLRFDSYISKRFKLLFTIYSSIAEKKFAIQLSKIGWNKSLRKLLLSFNKITVHGLHRVEKSTKPFYILSFSP